MLPASSEDEGLKVSGYVCAPHKARGNRSYQYFFVHGRAVRSKILQAALEQAYRNSLFTGRFPSCVLYLTMRWSEVDVNVHPAKIEVKFLHERKVFDGVYYAALSALRAESGAPLHAPDAQSSSDAPRAADDGATGDTARIPEVFLPSFSEQGGHAAVRDVAGWRAASPRGGTGAYEKPPAPRIDRAFRRDEKAYGARGFDAPLRRGVEAPLSAGFAPRRGDGAPARLYLSGGEGAATTLAPPGEAEGVSDEAPDGGFRYVGEAFGTYVLVEHGGSLWLIDKHAAHERMHFDRLKSSGYEPMAQLLLEPVVCRLGREDAALLSDNAEAFARLGFVIEPFGEEAVAVRQIPSDIAREDTEATLSEILGVLRRGGKPDAGSRLDGMLHTIACKAAVKAGKSSDPKALKSLIENVLSGRVRYCPHGRPVAVEWTKTSIDRSFKRT